MIASATTRPRSAALFVVLGLAAVGCQPPVASGPPASPSTAAHAKASTAASAPSSAGGGPALSAVQSIMSRTVEVANPSTHFVPVGVQATAHDDAGGTFTAVVGERANAADAGGKIVFFWHGTRYVGTNSDTETESVSLKGGTDAFKITYSHFAPNDPACCASLPPVTIEYAWTDNEGFVGSSLSIPHQGNAIKVRVPPAS